MFGEPEYTYRNTNEPQKAEQFGAVIVFPHGMTKEECQTLIRRLLKAEPGIGVDGPRGFNPNYGTPVWYVP
jgi:hypothetical protein